MSNFNSNHRNFIIAHPSTSGYFQSLNKFIKYTWITLINDHRRYNRFGSPVSTNNKNSSYKMKQWKKVKNLESKLCRIIEKYEFAVRSMEIISHNVKSNSLTCSHSFIREEKKDLAKGLNLEDFLVSWKDSLFTMVTLCCKGWCNVNEYK